MASQNNIRFCARFAETAEDLRAAQVLRTRSFFPSATGHPNDASIDQDRFDPLCRHVLVEDTRTGRLVCCFRLLPLRGGSEIAQSYSAQFYELAALKQFDGPMVEIGRFCIESDDCNANILRVAWGALTRFVDDEGIKMLFGCSSFHGVNADAYLDAFAMLKERHLAPVHWRPAVKAPMVFRFAQTLRHRKPDAKRGIRGMPPLLRSYLEMGGWVSDHAVVDRDMNTLHVFTGLEIGAIPATRARILRSLTG